jgi:hypothetical protein
LKKSAPWFIHATKLLYTDFREFWNRPCPAREAEEEEKEEEEGPDMEEKSGEVWRMTMWVMVAMRGGREREA